MEKKQGSVAWLFEQVWINPVSKSQILEQAKAMHKEEIKDAISVGYNMATPSEPYENLHKGDKYYNQKFGGNNE